MKPHTRRRFVRTVGVAGALALAGCTSGGSGGDDGGSDGGGSDGGSDGTTDGTTDGGGSDFTQTDTVDMTDELKFAPEKIEVEAGTTVTWKNVGSIGHSVTAYEDKIPDDAAYFASGGFDSEQAARDAYPDKGNITKGGSYQHTFETTGEYEYFCIPHEMNGMVGTVKVV